jgi:hypothetical protein
MSEVRSQQDRRSGKNQRAALKPEGSERKCSGFSVQH